MSASVTLAAPPTTPGRAVNITLWAGQVLFAALFAFGGLTKLFGHQPEMIETFAKIGFGQGFRYLVGALELAGAIGLLIPRLSGLAALELACVMVGAIFTHLLAVPPVSHALIPAVLVVLFGLIAWGRWPATKALIGRLRR